MLLELGMLGRKVATILTWATSGRLLLILIAIAIWLLALATRPPEGSILDGLGVGLWLRVLGVVIIGIIRCQAWGPRR